MKKSILYVGHTYHRKTRSASFLDELVSGEYEKTDFFLDPQVPDSYSGLDALSGREFDVLVCWQVMPDLSELRRRVKWGIGVFFPMYDYFQGCMTIDRPIWYDYRGFRIVNFCRKLHDKLTSLGFDSKYIQYFPQPAKNVDKWGDEHSVFFWQRITRLNLPLLAKVLKNFSLNRLHLHKAMDPGETFTEAPVGKGDDAKFFGSLKMKTSSWYRRKEDMTADMLDSAMYMAPRPYEGIGMSFLEAMANGRCVVAPDCPTMNEYIVDGETGILYHWDDAAQKQNPPAADVPGDGIRAIQHNALAFIRRGYRRWRAERFRILDWISSEPKPDRDKLAASAREMGWIDSAIEDQPRPNAAELEGDVVVKEPTDAPLDDGVPDVTVVTVVFNALKSGRGEQFRQCLDSVQAQTGVRLEHLVVDGASKDGTLEFLQSYRNRFIRMRILSKPDKGIYDAMNRGLALARGKYVIFLNSDDYYHDPLGMKESFMRLEKTFCDFSYAPIRVLREENDEPMDHPNSHPRVGKIFVNMEFSHQSVMIRRDAFIALHGFDLRYRSAADYDSVLRLILTGHRACCVPRSFVTFRMGGFSCVNMVKSQRETGTIFSRLYNKYAGASLTREDGLRIYLTGCFPLELKEQLFSYYVSAFGENMLAAETDDDGVPANLHNLIAFKHRLLPLKKGMSPSSLARCALPAVARHPLWFVEFAFRYRRAIKLIGRKDAARMAFNEMGKRLYERRRRSSDARMLERAAAASDQAGAAPAAPASIDLALPVHTNVAPSDFWNVYGTYEVEPWGVWAGKDMLVKVHVPEEYVGRRLSAGLVVGGYAFAESPRRLLGVTVNGVEMPAVELDHLEPRRHEVEIPADAVKSPLLNFRLSLDADFVPNELGHSTDTRRLGIAFGGLSVALVEERK